MPSISRGRSKYFGSRCRVEIESHIGRDKEDD